MPLPVTNPNVWRHQAGGGCASLFGLPFFLVGVGVIVLTFVPADVHGGDDLPFYFGIPFGLIFATVGGVFLFGRMELMIDRSAGTAIRNWKLLSKTVKSQTSQLKEFDRISLRSEIRKGKNSSYTVYPVRLAGEGVKNFDLTQSRDENEARKEAEVLSKLLSLPIHDETAGSLRIRESDSLDESIKDKFAQGKETNVIPDPPAKLKSRINYDGSHLQVEIPPPGFNGGFLVALIAIGAFELIFISAFAIPFLTQTDISGPPLIFVAVFGLIFLGVPTLFLVGLIAHNFIATQSVSVSSDSLQVSKGWPSRKTTKIPRNEIEEFYLGVKKPGTRNSKAIITLGSSKEIVAVSDTAQITFGGGLPKDEITYLYALAKGILVS